MTYSISHWSGRLGNNIQQVANAILLSQFSRNSFNQKLNHEIIEKFYIDFSGNPEKETEEIFGRFYSWEPLVHCEKGILEGENEVGLNREFIYSNIRSVCRDYVSKYFRLPEKDPLDENTIVMHLRSGDAFHRVFEPGINYVPNPLIFYLNLIDSYDKCILITEPDKENPILHELMKINKVQIQTSSVANDFATLMSAKNIALSGVGTFAVAAALCSNSIQNLYTTDLLLTEHLNYTMLIDTDVTVNVMELENYIPVFPCSWKNTEEQRKFILEYR